MTESDSLIQQRRQALSASIVQSVDTSPAVAQLLSLNVPQNNKFALLDFSKIVSDNGQSLSTLKRLAGGLNILEKYGRHLLKPAENRSNMWRTIKFNNSIFRDRVDTVKGGRDIMHKMGYSVWKSDGVAFPDDVEPNQVDVLKLVTDLVLFRKELDKYMAASYPQGNEQSLPEQVSVKRQQVDGRPDAEQSPTASMAMGPQSASTQISSQPVQQQEVLLRQPADAGAIPKRAPIAAEKAPALEMTTPAEPVSSASADHQVPSIRCDICGENNADYVCLQCDNKQLCQGCDVKWHKHPKRQNHSLQKLRSDVSEPVGTGSTHQDQYQQHMWQLQQQQQQQQAEQQYQLQQKQAEHQFQLRQQQQQQAERQYQLQQQQQQQQQLQQLERFQQQQETFQQQLPDMRGSHGNSGPVSMYPAPVSSQNYMPGYSLPPEHLLQQRSNDHAKSQPHHPYAYGYHQHPPARNSSHQPVGSQPGVMVPQLWTSQANIVPQIPGTPGTGTRDSQYATMLPTSCHQGNMFATNHGTMHGGDGQYATMHHLQGTSRAGDGQFAHISQVPTSANMPILPGPSIPGQNVRQSLDPYGQQYHGTYPSNYDLTSTPSQIGGVMAPSTPSTGSSSGQVNFPPKSPGIRPEVNESINHSSELLLEIKTIKDVEKRQTRLSVYLLTLRGDVEDWNKQIDQIIRDNPDFFHDAMYISLNRRKRQHLKEIDELEKYKKELEVEIAEVHEKEAAGKLYMTKTLEAEAEALRMRFNAVKNDQPPPGSPTSKPSYPPPFKSFFPEVDQHHATAPGEKILPPKKPLVSHSTSEECEHLHVNSMKEDELCQEMRLGLNINQPSSGEARNQAAFNIPVDPPGMSGTGQKPKTSAAKETIPANVNRIPMRHGISEPNIVGKNNVGADISKVSQNKSASDLRPWGCQHCTFINQPVDKVCVCCARTSDNPIYEDLTAPALQCRHCTFENKQGCTVCEMCNETLAPPGEPMDYVTPTVNAGLGEIGQGESGMIVEEVGAESGEDLLAAIPGGPGIKAKALDNIISKDQDKVYWEKKEAQKKFEEAQKGGYDLPVTGPSQSHDLGVGTPSRSHDPGPRVPSQSHDLAAASTPSVKAPITEPAKSSLEQLKADDRGKPKLPPAGNAPKADVKPIRPEMNFANAIEQINMKREREQMSIDGHLMVKLIKEAESTGFDITEVEIAIQQGIENNMAPLDWLKTKWQTLIDQVMMQCAEVGRQASQNSIGDITAEEARTALVETSGDEKLAADLCVNERVEKFNEISGMGEFAREEILTALFQNKGDVDEAVSQLHQSKLQPYLDRIWTPANSPDREAEMAAAAAEVVNDPNNSVVNSAVIHEEFQTIIKNVDIDKERRIRMVLVEGKLQSWGRAETVITILDKELPELDLECSLPDIIEAVKNCGDRKSSLFYLNQECEVCYGRFPMSKICNLSSCNCKLCQGCVRQNFEYAIREKFVRNWGCPICQLPVLEEDETAATSYFEFLSLLLFQHVSQEVFELFETRLRDWHLQKDPNFRWCAHCAFGFIYDRPDDPAMVCHICKKRTCFNCKKEWEDQHEGRTCAEFTQFKIDNDPERQAKGIQLYLEENGIDCPSCKMRYALAKGGCLHFKCPQCGHEFCSACCQPFMQAGVCKQLKVCAKTGLHCHHPRDCFYYLRDNSVEDLQKLLKSKKVAFNTEAPPPQVDKQHCPVMEQKEVGADKKDEACGQNTGKGMAGLCMMHYKEYLVDLINKHDIDPVYILSIQDMTILIETRNEMKLPKPGQNEQEAQYRKKLQTFIIENIKLRHIQQRR